MLCLEGFNTELVLPLLLLSAAVAERGLPCVARDGKSSSVTAMEASREAIFLLVGLCCLALVFGESAAAVLVTLLTALLLDSLTLSLEISDGAWSLLDDFLSAFFSVFEGMLLDFSLFSTTVSAFSDVLFVVLFAVCLDFVSAWGLVLLTDTGFSSVFAILSAFFSFFLDFFSLLAELMGAGGMSLLGAFLVLLLSVL